jgi:hypothetical protein
MDIDGTASAGLTTFSAGARFDCARTMFGTGGMGPWNVTIGLLFTDMAMPKRNGGFEPYMQLMWKPLLDGCTDLRSRDNIACRLANGPAEVGSSAIASSGTTSALMCPLGRLAAQAE